MCRRLAIATVIALLLFFGLLTSISARKPVTSVVTRVIDGDTIEVRNVGNIRLIRIDAPEIIHPNKRIETLGKAAAAACGRLALNKKVKLEFDIQERDKYGRLLAYVWLPDGSMLNFELVRRGYANVSTCPPNVKYQDKLLKGVREAKANKRGLWAPQPTPKKNADERKVKQAQTDPVKITVYITRTGKKYHRSGCKYLARSKIPISLQEVKKRGYTPCKVCQPPN